MTVTDFRATPPRRNALVAMTIDVPALWETALASYRRVAVTG
jgi:hypothetical protein